MKCRSLMSEDVAVCPRLSETAIQYFGNHKNRPRLAAVSVMILMVLNMANFRALFS